MLLGGVSYLGLFVNGLTAALAAATAAVYLYAYTPLKKISAVNTLVGAVAGALPPVFGWSAAAGRLELGAGILFGILFFWQFPISFASPSPGFAAKTIPGGVRRAAGGSARRPARSLHALLGALALLAVSWVPVWAGRGTGAYAVLATALGAALVALGFHFHRD
ncbi:MAG: UbiA family prenyltransferase [Elusimicrobia bacterium]|nr:UbiA family prenyltransferase [Elusimicrobiota bacterium]